MWVWAKAFDLRTQADLFSLRYESRHIHTQASLLGIILSFPWLVVGMQALGALFQSMSLRSLSFMTSMLLGVVVLVVRQVWTISMGMRGVVISDMAQGIAASLLGMVIIIGLLAGLAHLIHSAV